MPRWIRVVAALLFIWCQSLAGPAVADEFKLCARCHGADGNSTKSNSPSIAGLDPGYAEEAMKDYRDGSRPCGLSSMKCKMAAKWSDEEIAAAATHYGAMARKAPDQAFDAARAEAGKSLHEAHCQSCHSQEAVEGKPHGGLLSGQWREYLDYALNQYQEGVWSQPDDMKKALAGLSPDDRAALLDFYASGK